MNLENDDMDVSEDGESTFTHEKNIVQRMRDYIDDHEDSESDMSIGSDGNTHGGAAKPVALIYHLDTGMGDATIIVGNDDAVFIDCCFEAATQRMIGIARKICDKDPSHIAISHFDKDHFYGLTEAWRAFPSAKIITPAEPEDLRRAAHVSNCPQGFRGNFIPNADLISRMQAIFSINGASQYKCSNRADNGSHCSNAPDAEAFISQSDAAPIALGLDVELRAIETHANRAIENLRNNNNSSLAWSLMADGINYYTAGDLETDHEDELVLGERMHIIKCGHHGSSGATSARFLENAESVVAIIQGAAAVHQHPRQDVLDRLEDAGVRIFATSCHTADLRHPEKFLEVGESRAFEGNVYYGDIAVIVWDDQTFSVSYIASEEGDANPDMYITFYDENGNDVDSDGLQIEAVEECLDLMSHTLKLALEEEEL